MAAVKNESDHDTFHPIVVRYSPEMTARHFLLAGWWGVWDLSVVLSLSQGELLSTIFHVLS